MINATVVDLSRLQFAATALYHFLFVPLTLGLSFLIAIMESVYVMTGRDVWRRMTMFWGLLFGVNFAMGVATGIVMEFQFGMNWSYYSQYVGDIFGAPLAIEGLMAFFLEATFVGLFFFGWDRLSRVGHLATTWLTALGANLSALWILIANGWMQHPTGATFNPETMRMEITNFMAVIFNPVAQAKFVHTVSAGYVCGSVFVMGVSAIFLLGRRHQDIARRSMVVAASFGLASALSVVVLGDESGYVTTQNQKMKLAAIEAIWHTEPAPAPLAIFAIPHQATESNSDEIKIPYLAGILTTRSLTQVVPGIENLIQDAVGRIHSGLTAYAALQTLRSDPNNAAARTTFGAHWRDLGYALLLKRYISDPTKATDAMIQKAANDTAPNVATLFWGFRIMAGIGFYFIAFFALSFWLASKSRIGDSKAFLWAAVCTLPLPWIAIELGWIVAEFGRQPWIIEGVLPTFYAASGLSVLDLVISLSFFVLIYTCLAIVELVLLVKIIKHGPDEGPDSGKRIDESGSFPLGAYAAPDRGV